MNEIVTTGWSAGPATYWNEDDASEERIHLGVFSNEDVATTVLTTKEAKALVRHLVLLIDDAEKANEESK